MSDLFVCKVAFAINKVQGKRFQNVCECPSVCKRDPVAERRIELKERAIVIDHRHQLLQLSSSATQ